MKDQSSQKVDNAIVDNYNSQKQELLIKFSKFEKLVLELNEISGGCKNYT